MLLSVSSSMMLMGVIGCWRGIKALVGVALICWLIDLFSVIDWSRTGGGGVVGMAVLGDGGVVVVGMAVSGDGGVVVVSASLFTTSHSCCA